MTEKLYGISGNMFSGKSDELLRRVKRAEVAGKNVLVFKPAVDNRWGKDSVKSRSGSEHAAIAIRSSKDMLDYLKRRTKMVAIDEVQPTDSQVIPVIQTILDENIEVHFSGLPLDFRGETFGCMGELLALADDLTRLTAICVHLDKRNKKCGKEATRTQRLVNGLPAPYMGDVIEIEGDDRGIVYEARCVNHHEVPGKPVPVLK